MQNLINDFYSVIHKLGILNYHNFEVSGEEWIVKQALKNIKNATFIDVGAHSGEYSKMLAQANPDSVIYCFEPHPISYQSLLNNIKAYKNIHPFNYAIGNHIGKGLIYDYVNADGSWHASTYKEVFEIIHKGTVQSHEIEMIKLDDFCSLNHIDRINYLKVDTEGNEYDVLKGFCYHIELKKVDIIQFEFNELNVISRVFFKDFWDMLADNHYLFRLLPNALFPMWTYVPLMCEIFAYQNIVAFLKERVIIDVENNVIQFKLEWFLYNNNFIA